MMRIKIGATWYDYNNAEPMMVEITTAELRVLLDKALSNTAKDTHKLAVYNTFEMSKEDVYRWMEEPEIADKIAKDNIDIMTAAVRKET